MTRKNIQQKARPVRVIRKDTPKTPTQAAQTISEIGKLLRASEREAKRKAPQIARLKDTMQRILDEVAAAQAPLLDEAKRLAELVHAYAVEHRAELTENGTYTTAKFPSGSTLVWYQAPRSVCIKDEELFFVEAKRSQHRDILLRTVFEPNREAILLHEDVLKGISCAHVVRQGRFEIHPGNTDSCMHLPDAAEQRVWQIVPPKKRKAAKKKQPPEKNVRRR